MTNPDNHESAPVAQVHVAPQRIAPARGRGPHPLSLFLATVTRVCGDDRARLAQVLAGLRRYQQAPPVLPRPQQPVVAAIGTVTLRDYGQGKGAPVIIVPSLINPPTVLDLANGNSLLAALAAAGLRPLLVDWGDTEPHGLDGAVADRLVPLAAALGEPVRMAGYCLGGTLALGAAALLGARVMRLALLATPWHFGGYDPAVRAGLAQWWQGSRPMAHNLGVMPIELLQPAFWSLDEAGLVAKYAALANTDDPAALAAFVQLEDWSNSGTPLSLAAAEDLAEGLFAADSTGTGQWQISGQRIDPATLACPILDVIASRDRIVPTAAALSSQGVGVALQLEAGHVGMVVGRQAPQQLWQPLADWLRD